MSAVLAVLGGLVLAAVIGGIGAGVVALIVLGDRRAARRARQDGGYRR